MRVPFPNNGVDDLTYFVHIRIIILQSIEKTRFPVIIFFFNLIHTVSILIGKRIYTPTIISTIMYGLSHLNYII